MLSYDILDNLNSGHGPDWYRLDRQDGVPFNDRDDTWNLDYEGNPRGLFRLHTGGDSHGCVTIDWMYEREEYANAMWVIVKDMMNNTTTKMVKDRNGVRGMLGLAGEKEYFGTMVVK